MAGAVRIRRRLVDLATAARLARGAADSSISSKTASPLAFGICTKGPSHELWVCYATMENGHFEYHVRVVDECLVGLPETIKPFPTKVHQILKWGSDDLLNKVAEDLHEVYLNIGLLK